jgi:hypothetical protein
VSDLGQWSTAEPLLRGLPSWIANEEEQKRIASYQLYEEIFWSVPNAFKLTQRGDEDSPIYLPAPRTIVETVHRYMANGLHFVPLPGVGTSAQATAAQAALDAFFKRERFYSKFNANKREGIFRGDWAFKLSFDLERDPGSRISINAVDPASIFPIYNEENLDEIIGYHIAFQQDFGGKPAISRETFRKVTGKGGPSPITHEHMIFEVDKWGGPGMDEESVLAVVEPLTTLPQPIDSLPIYWIQNFQQTGTIYGSSELRGMERIIAALNQGISDEELSLAFQGLGLYKSNAGTPVDADGNETTWNIGPTQVVDLPDGDNIYFDRVQGISTVAPYLDHLRFLIEQLDEAAATPAIAKGRVDVNVAESGISLMLQMGPLLARCAEKEQVVTDVLGNLTWDLTRKWFPAIEGGSLDGVNELQVVEFAPAYGEKLPVNGAQRFTEIMAMVQAKVVSKVWARMELAKLGYVFPSEADMLAQITQESAAEATVAIDPFGDRVDQETDGGLS